MSRLELWFPAKPYNISQAWGIYNPSYVQFGFSRHNGVDFLVGADRLVHCPVAAKVEDVGFSASKGNYVRLVSTEKHEVLGKECYVGLIFMHGEKNLVKKGQVLKVGEPLMIPDNTGFSTGPHTHMTAYRLSKPKNLPENRLDTNKETNYTFDPQLFWNGYYAQDVDKVMTVLRQTVALLSGILAKWTTPK